MSMANGDVFLISGFIYLYTDPDSGESMRQVIFTQSGIFYLPWYKKVAVRSYIARYTFVVSVQSVSDRRHI